MTFKPFTTGVLSLAPNEEELGFIAREAPWGFILFARNIESREQVKALCASLREANPNTNAPVLVDQEGGRVQRIGPPIFQAYPPGARLGDLYQTSPEAGERAAWLLGRLHAFDLLSLGIDVNCTPLLDVLAANAHKAIGDRALGGDPAAVTHLGRALCDGHLAGGVVPVIKHMPGQGRAKSDSHYDLPRISAPLDELRATDFAPFAALTDMPMAMTTHVVFEAIDADEPATTSTKVIGGMIRNELGFDGFLLSDDVSMEALAGDYAARTRAILAAGCDIVLHCHAIMEQLRPIAASCEMVDEATSERSRKALAGRGKVDGSDEQACREEFNALMAGASV
jgi:beta-N-acetylhexosaminidase